MTYPTIDFPGSRDSRGRLQLRTLSRRAVLVTTFQALVTLAACSAPNPAPSITPSPSPVGDQATRSALDVPSGTLSVIPVTSVQGGNCAGSLPAVIPPTPIPYPGYAQEEPTTGLHVTSDALAVDLASYRLKVSGLVDRPLSLSYDDLRCLLKVQAEVQLTCPGFFIDWATLAGPTLASVIALAGPQRKADRVTLTSINGYAFPFSLDEAQAEENFLAYEWVRSGIGEPLPPSHGFPVRAALPRRAGSAWVKWLEEIKVS